MSDRGTDAADKLTVSGGQRYVGEPIQEARLVARLVEQAHALFPPGPGRSAWIVLEPSIGAGRPDALIVHASETARRAHATRGLRLSTPATARALSDAPDDRLGLSTDYAREVRRSLDRVGWTPRAFQRSSTVVSDSVAIEAKLGDARRALHQVAKFRSSAHRSAILMPEATSARASRATLDLLGTGLIIAKDRVLVWQVPPRRSELSASRSAWLAELLLRGTEDGTAHRISASRKRESADFIARTLGAYRELSG